MKNRLGFLKSLAEGAKELGIISATFIVTSLIAGPVTGVAVSGAYTIGRVKGKIKKKK